MMPQTHEVFRLAPFARAIRSTAVQDDRDGTKHVPSPQPATLALSEVCAPAPLRPYPARGGGGGGRGRRGGATRPFEFPIHGRDFTVQLTEFTRSIKNRMPDKCTR